MQSFLAEKDVTVYSYTCNICPGCSCTRDVRVKGSTRIPKIRQVCSEFPGMDGHTAWKEIA